MPDRRKAQISSRRRPKQARSSDLVAAVLEAAVQVLLKEGGKRFTTARVAERAGVSVGSLYQYFPNKASILFRLQSDEWRRTTAMLSAILADTARPPLDRLRSLTSELQQVYQSLGAGAAGMPGTGARDTGTGARDAAGDQDDDVIDAEFTTG